MVLKHLIFSQDNFGEQENFVLTPFSMLNICLKKQTNSSFLPTMTIVCIPYMLCRIYDTKMSITNIFLSIILYWIAEYLLLKSIKNFLKFLFLG